MNSRPVVKRSAALLVVRTRRPALVRVGGAALFLFGAVLLVALLAGRPEPRDAVWPVVFGPLPFLLLGIMMFASMGASTSVTLDRDDGSLTVRRSRWFGRGRVVRRLALESVRYAAAEHETGPDGIVASNFWYVAMKLDDGSTADLPADLCDGRVGAEALAEAINSFCFETREP